jgi:carboxyl-terminal processing protease
MSRHFGGLLALFLTLTVTLADAGPRQSQAPQPAGWTDAFEAMHARLATEYPFGQWKAIDWDRLRDAALRRIRAAEAEKRADEFYLALRGYVYAIPDGHIRIRYGGTEALRDARVGADFGVTLARLAEGRVVIDYVSPDLSAAGALRTGDEVTHWNGHPISEALSAVSTIWANAPQPTRADREYQQLRFLTRAPSGTRAAITVKTPDDAARVVPLAAVPDGGAGLARTELLASPEQRKNRVQFRLLPSGHGYIRLTGFFGETKAQTDAIFPAFAEAITWFNQLRAPGLVLDLRQNSGGIDELAARIAGIFYRGPANYLDAEYFDPASGTFAVKKDEHIAIAPQQPAFGGPVAALISPGTVSAGEGLARAIQQLPQGATVGFSGTHGSYGMTGGRIELPEGIVVSFPVGRSIDENGRILLDADARLNGGVDPDVRVALTAERLRQMRIDGRDVELEAAIALLREGIRK